MEKRGCMKFYNTFYIGKGINKKKKRKILKALKKQETLQGIYLLCARYKAPHLLEIMSMEELFRGHYDLKSVIIFGFTDDQLESFFMARDLVETWYKLEQLEKGKQHLWASYTK